MNDNNIYGTIGFTLLCNEKRHQVLIFADSHNNLDICPNNISIDKWLEKKMTTSLILLEEVNRNGVELGELFSSSLHTQKLKQLFMNNQNDIIPVDIRPEYIPYSWILVKDEKSLHSENMSNYIKNVYDFFLLNDKKMKKKIPNYVYNILNDEYICRHFYMLQKKFYIFVKKYKNVIDSRIIDIINQNSECLEEFDNILDSIMEWYIIYNIYSNNNNKNVIVHAGLAHTDNIIKILVSLYDYKIKEQEGINKLIDGNPKKDYGCVNIKNKIDVQFGGKK